MKHSLLRPAACLLALALCSCAETSTAVSSTASSVTAAISSISDTSSADINPLDSDGYWNVRNDMRRRNRSTANNASMCFPDGVKGYRIEGGPYKVDLETLQRLTTADCVGSGSVMWEDFRIMGNNPDRVTGEIPVDKLKDPVYLSMNWPSEVQTYMAARINPQIMSAYSESYNRILTIGAIYKVAGADLRDSDTFTVCLGRMELLLKTESQDWYTASSTKYPYSPGNIYYLPWELEHTLGHADCSGRVKYFSDHVEISLTGADLNATAAKSKGVEGAVLHFWGQAGVFGSEKVLGVVAGLTAWIKEENMVGKLAVAYGADWYPNPGQCFSGYNVKLTTEPRFVYGHNVGPESYDKIMNSSKVLTLLGLQ